jgi:hypothetical protein
VVLLAGFLCSLLIGLVHPVLVGLLLAGLLVFCMVRTRDQHVKAIAKRLQHVSFESLLTSVQNAVRAPPSVPASSDGADPSEPIPVLDDDAHDSPHKVTEL